MSANRTTRSTDPSVLVAVSNAMVALHKEQFGRGPERARSNFAGPDALVCLLYDAFLPAEHAMIEIGEAMRVRESRMFMQTATGARFIRAVEELVYRKVTSFASASDPENGMVMEIFVFKPEFSDGDGATA
jgi:uncharacterized protein YbcI